MSSPYPTQAQIKALPALYEQDGKADPIAVVRYFFGGRGAFYATEFDRESGVFFGWMVSPLGADCDEWGYLSLKEILETGDMVAGCERDQYFTPKPVSQATKQNGDPSPPIY